MSQAGSLGNGGGGGSGNVEFLTGNSGGPVGPDGANNINIVGSGSTTVVGTPVNNTLTITVAGSGISWHTISASQTMAVNNGYICSGGITPLALTLPAASALGDIIEITLDGANSFVITQAAGQQIRIGNQSSTSGVTGSLTSTQQGDSIRLVCQTANLKWNVLSTMGNLTIA